MTLFARAKEGKHRCSTPPVPGHTTGLVLMFSFHVWTLLLWQWETRLSSCLWAYRCHPHSVGSDTHAAPRVEALLTLPGLGHPALGHSRADTLLTPLRLWHGAGLLQPPLPLAPLTLSLPCSTLHGSGINYSGKKERGKEEERGRE